MNKYRFQLLGIIFMALALRLYNLTYHSLWFDEAISVYWARQSAPRILEVGFTLVEDRLPPLYYLMLKGWTAMLGFSEIGVRSLSVCFGVLLVPVVAAIAARLFNRRIARLTALLVAINPFLIWYSQEARMYAPAVLFSALTVWAFLEMTNKCHHLYLIPDSDYAPGSAPYSFRSMAQVLTLPTLLYPFLFTIFATAGLYSHLYTGFLLPALGLWLVISCPRAWRTWLMFGVSGLLITLAFAPLALATWRFSGEAASGDPFNDLGQRTWWLLQAFTVWKAPLSPALSRAIPAGITLFALAAFIPPKYLQRSACRLPRRTPAARPHSLVLVTLLLSSPFVVATLLLLRNYLAFFGERYFIVMVPWFLLLTAVGADNLSRLVGAYFDGQNNKATPARGSQATAYLSSRAFHYAPSLLLVLVTALPLPGQWSIPAAKEYWRQSVAYLADHAAPNHAILIHPDWVRFPFQFYFRGPGQTYAAFSNVTPATGLDGPLQGVVGDHPIVWLVQSHLDGPDPDRLVEQWFDGRYPLVTELYPPGIALKGYAPRYQLDKLPPDATPVDLEFQNGMHLIGFRADAEASATDQALHPPSGWIHVTLYWTAARPITTAVRPFVHLVGPQGVWGISLERAGDALTRFPPSRWPAAPAERMVIRHDLDVNLNPETPPGMYQLVVGLEGYAEQHFLSEVEIR